MATINCLFYPPVRMEEREPLEEILKCAYSCKAHLKDILDFVSAYPGEDLGAISRKLGVAWKVYPIFGFKISFLFFSPLLKNINMYQLAFALDLLALVS